MGDVNNTIPVDRRSPFFPLTTGASAALLGTTEPRLAETVRRGRIDPPPTIVAGRRLWTHDQVVQAAQALGNLDDEQRQRIDAAFGLEGAGGAS
jgi:hypothetical protein